MGRIQGLLLMASAGFYITMSNCLVQFAYKSTHSEISPHVFLFYRSIIIFLLNLIFMFVGRVHPFGGHTKNIFLLFLIGMAGTGQILFTFLALERVPVADVTVMQFTAPVFTMTISFVLLGVSCTLFDTLCGCVSFVGVVIMTKPSIFLGKYRNDRTEYPTNLNPDEDAANANEHDCVIGIAFALLASVFVSMFYVLNKILGQKHDLTVTIFYPSMMGIITAPIVSGIVGESLKVPWHWASIAVVLLVGLLSFVHLMFVAEALQLEDAGPASLVRNADIVYAFILQFFFMGVKPEWSTIVGATVVVVATTMIALKRILESKQKIDAE